MELDRLLELGDRRDLVVGEVERVGATLEERAARSGREVVREAERTVVVGGRLAVRAQPGGLLRGGGRVAEHRLGVAARTRHGARGVRGRPCSGRGLGEREEDGPVQREAAGR